MIRLFLVRELHAALLNRLIAIFAGLMLLLGVFPILLARGNAADLAPHILLLGSLYLVPLFAILAGTASAQNETEEHPILMSQPVRPAARLLGKWMALELVLACGSLLLVLPGWLAGADGRELGVLGSQAAGLAGTFAALGLAAGFSCADRIKAHLISLCLWLFFLISSDLLALAAIPLSLARSAPEAWVAILMLNPMDAFRIGALLTLERIPFDPLTAPPLATWWIRHLTLWFFLISSAWTVLFLFWAARRLERAEP